MPALLSSFRFSLSLMAALAGGLVAARDAGAQARPRVAIVELFIEGDAPPELRDQLEKNLAGGLFAAGYTVVERSVVLATLQEKAPGLIGCVTTTCLERMAPLVGAKRFIRARVDVRGAAYNIELELLTPGADGGILDRVETTCAVCTLQEANDAMSRAASELEEDRPREVAVFVRSSPPGAMVAVNGEPRGKAPMELRLLPGEYTVTATLDGEYIPAEEVISVAEGATERQEVSLELVRRDAVGGGTRFGTWKWVAGGAAVAGLAGGITLLVLDGQPTGRCVDPPGPEPEICSGRYNTLTGGIVVTGAGVALGALSIYMFLNDEPKERTPQVGVVPTTGGGVVRVGVSF